MSAESQLLVQGNETVKPLATNGPDNIMIQRSTGIACSEPDIMIEACKIEAVSASDQDSGEENETEEAIWSEDVEAAFEEAMVMYPSVGRRKICVDGQMYGRNELIAKFIEQKNW